MKPKKIAKTTPSRREEVLTDFATLRIPVTAEQLDAALQQAQDAGLTHLDFLHRFRRSLGCRTDLSNLGILEVAHS